MPFDQRSLIHQEVWFPDGPKIPKNRNCLKNRKIIQNAKTQKTSRNMRYALLPEVSNPSGSVVSTLFCEAKSAKKNFFSFAPNKNIPMWDHFFTLFFPKDSKSLKILDIQLREVGAKKRLNGTSKVNTQTDGQTDRRTFRLIESIGPEGRCFENLIITLFFQSWLSEGYFY